jgi:glyoxylase-like metal-dependent hydrolase (beta-lactamase superfamily II)
MTKPKKPSRKRDIGACRESAPGVYCLEVGKGIMRSNVYFVRSGKSWALVDAASANCSQLIQETAESLFGAKTPPTAILLTHDHPDHAGSALELARIWGCSVYLHPDEMPLAVNKDLATVKRYANPLDRWLIMPMLRLMPRRRVEAMLSKSSLKEVARALEPGAGVPGLPDWECIPAPGHTPGQIAFFRASDRALITGDAVLTVDLNSLWGMLLWTLHIKRPKISGPPWYSTWDKRVAKESVAALAGLKPRVLASGHGLPMAGNGIAGELRALAESRAGGKSG